VGYEYELAIPLIVVSVMHTSHLTSTSPHATGLMAPIRGRPIPVPRSWQRVLGALLVFLSIMVMLRCSKWLTLGFHPTKTALPIPHKIWQLWIHPTKQPSHDWRDSSHAWVHLNPDWDYVFATLNHSSARAWVGDVFRHRPDVVDAFTRANETIQKADLLRYLWLLEEGGVYSDLDAQCAKPVRDWIPPRYRNTTGLVIGVEIDDYFEGHYDPNIPYIQLCQWTIMARPHHPTIAHVIDTVIGRLQNWEAGDVEELTGPKVNHLVLNASLVEPNPDRSSQKQCSKVFPRSLVDRTKY
jgi:hypothetical protein